MTYHAVPGGWMIDGDDNVYPSQREALAHRKTMKTFFTKTDWDKARPDRIAGYYVMFEDETGEHVFSHFAVNRKQTALVAWHLANTLRDEMNEEHRGENIIPA